MLPAIEGQSGVFASAAQPSGREDARALDPDAASKFAAISDVSGPGQAIAEPRRNLALVRSGGLDDYQKV